ncbi:MAG: protein kinase, partial [Gemmatimonadetes bacterium]|nr:protein kinase [Gemmatimonadota bacterium]
MGELPGGVNGVLAGRYRIDREIGQGGMATVYLAHDLRHDSLVAVKVLRQPLAEQLAGERFSREIRIAANLRHPNIVAVFDSGETDEGRPFYVMPYVEGETLEARIAREGALPIAEAVDIAAQIADALAHAHEQGFVHRDVKPGNVLLSHGRALLSDFGIARAVKSEKAARLTETGVSLGTVAYMSPEQAAGGPVDGRSDIYSLGCVLYEMVAGTPPFSGPARAVLARHAADSVPSLRVVRETVPPALEAAVVRAMAKLAADRYTDGTAFRDAIHKAIESAPVAPIPLPARRGALRAAVFAAIVVVAAILLGRFGLVGTGDLDDQRIMVFPLVVPPDFAGPRTVGEDVATMIGNALDGTGPLRWIDAWPLLEPEWRDNVRQLPSNAPRDLARERRCAFYLMGRIVAVSADSADVSLTLHDARGDSTIVTRSAKGSIADAWRQGLRAVNQLLPSLIPGASPDLVAEWEDHDPSAIASFLLGEAAFRRARLEDALRSFRAAVAADSTLGLAAIRGAMTATWIHRADEAESFIRVAQRQRLAPRYAAFARAYELYMRGVADSAAQAFRDVLELDPEMTAAWMQLGEVYTHLLPRTGNPDSLAEVAFAHANQLDPAASNVLFHLIEIRIRKGEGERVTPLVRQFVAADADRDVTARTEIMHSCVTGGPRRMNWRDLVTQQPLEVLTAAAALAGGGAQPECAEAALRAIFAGDTAQTPEADGRRWGAFLLLQGVLLARGQTDIAMALIDSARTRWGFGSSLHLILAVIDDAFVEPAREVARADAESYGQGYRASPFITRLWALGLFEARVGSIAVAEEVVSELEQRAAASGAAKDRVLARSAAIHVMLARGDSVNAFAALEA